MKTEFEQFTKDFIRFHFDKNPSTAIYLGDHSYDKKIKPATRESLKQDLESYKEKLNELKAFDFKLLPVELQFDYDVMNHIIRSYIFESEKMKTEQRSPVYYSYFFSSITSFLNKNYAPLNERLDALNNLLNLVPEHFNAAEDLLVKRINKIEFQHAIDSLAGIENMIKTELPDIFKQEEVSDEVRNEFESVSQKALESVEKFRKFLNSLEVVEFGDEFRLGKELFFEMLSVNEEIDYPFEKIKQLGEAELKRLLDEFNSLLAEHNIHEDFEESFEHPTEESLISDTRATLKELLEFVRSNDIIDLSDDLNCLVIEMPSYMNIGFAAMGTSGPYEKTNESFYFVNPPKKHWDDERKKEWLSLFNYPTLKLISIHEAFPGHYSHFFNAYKNAREIAKLSFCYSYAEAWAHYTEEMMIEKGYGAGDVELRLSMIKEALIRCCRYLVAIGLHCESMTVKEATEFFQQNAKLNYTIARQEAERGVYDPGYLNYTLGKIIIKEMKSEFNSKHPELSDKDFHNRFVNFGCPTLAIAKRYFYEDAV